jgi:hypothetical protein
VSRVGSYAGRPVYDADGAAGSTDVGPESARDVYTVTCAVAKTAANSRGNTTLKRLRCLGFDEDAGNMAVRRDMKMRDRTDLNR